MGYSRSRAKCVSLQYPSSATRGVKEALSCNKNSSNQIHTSLQEKETILSKASNSVNKECPVQMQQLESGVFYELSNRKGMECEKYQDCSWFQQSSLKPNYNNKLSPAETFDPLLDSDEFGLPMQCASAQISSWGDDSLELFTDDILEDNFRMKEKNKNWLFNENFYTNKEYDDNTFESSNINYSLKKTDSVDSMKNISSTNLAKVIPISYKERLNNVNYGLAMLNDVKKEVELFSPEPSVHLLDSDDGDLYIGREEVVEEVNEDLPIVSGKEKLNPNQVKMEVVTDGAENKKLSEEQKINEIIDENNFQPLCLPIKHEPETNQHTKFDLNFDINKLNFEPTMNVNTPDLDFMDLVDFINEEMRQENNIPANSDSTKNIGKVASLSEDQTSTEDQAKTESVSSNGTSIDSSSTFPQSQVSGDNLWHNDSRDNSTVDFNEISNTGVSIAERIKTSCKRRTTKNIKDLIDTEDESSESVDDDDDEDYDYKEDIARRKCPSVRKRLRSSLSDSSGDGKKLKEDSTYRERRDKNNEASRRSRQNRKARERHMYETLEEEEKRNVKLKAEADVLEKQVTSLRQLLLQVVLRKEGAT